MSRFHDYAELEKQIHAPEELKARVLQAARASKKQTLRLDTAQSTAKNTARRKGGLYSRGFSFLQKAAVIAILLVCLPVTAYAAVKYTGLIEHLREFGMEDAAMENLVETYGQEAAVIPTISDPALEEAVKPPEFSVLEAMCDDHSLYMVVQVKPMDDRYLLVPGELGINEDVSSMQIPGVSSGRTIEQYAQELGKEILMVSAWPDNRNEYGVSPGVLSACGEDGTVYKYFTGENPSGLKEFPLKIDCHYKTVNKELEQPVDERFSFEVTIKNKGTSEQVKEYTKFEDTGLGLEIHSLTIQETEMGWYAKFTFTPTDGNNYRMTLVDAEGNYFMGLPGSGHALNEENGDGTYSCETSIRKPASLEGLQFVVVQHTEDDMNHIGPFKLLG